MNDLEQAADYLRRHLREIPRTAVILGSGLGNFAESLEGAVAVPYESIPNWPRSTAIGHAGKLMAGRSAGTPVIALSGRAHLYEGYTPQQAAFAVRVMGKLGVRSLVVTNAAGGINLSYGQGALVLISDHINLQGVNPLCGPNDDTLGPRFPDMTEAYDARYRAMAREEAARLGIRLEEGVYAGLLGPSYETPAEIRYLRAIGADLVGMSTVPEVIAAAHLGLRVLAVSCVTNMAAGILPQKLSHAEVMETGLRVRETFASLLAAVLPRLEG